jgi:hypothetical protein
MKLTAVLLLCVATALAAVDLPVPAQVVRADNGASIDNALVSSETLDQIDYSIGEGAQAATTSLKRSLIRLVVYGEVQDIDKAKADGYANRNDAERAAQAYAQAAVTSSYWRNRELCYVLAAENFRKTKPDDALKALADLEAKAPRSTFLPRAYGLRVQILLAKGDRPGAEAAIVALAKFDPARAAIARADLLRGDKKPAEAAKELQGIWGTAVKPGETGSGDGDAPAFDAIGFQLASDLVAAGDAAGANAVLLGLCYAPIAKASQSKAHLALAAALTAASDKPTLLSAFDHAIMGGGLPGGDRTGAKKAALKVLEKFDKMPDMKDEAAEYRSYVNAL